jgi:hypothetical protein
MKLSYFRNVRRSEICALAKEAMAMREGHLLKRAGTGFVRYLLWMLMVFGLLGAILIAAADVPLVGVVAFVGVPVAVMAAIMTMVVLWSGAYEEAPRGGRDSLGSPPDHGGDDRGGDWPIGA